MAEFKTFHESVEVAGEVVEAFIAGFPALIKKTALRILRNHGIDDPGPDKWYVLQDFLDAMKEISDRYDSELLYSIGRKIALHAKIPPDMMTLEQCLAGIDTAYHMNHRYGEIGHYEFSKHENGNGMNKATMVCRNPYPSVFDRGVIEGFAKRFAPEHVDIIVRLDENAPCRQHGYESCTYIISWL